MSRAWRGVLLGVAGVALGGCAAVVRPDASDDVAAERPARDAADVFDALDAPDALERLDAVDAADAAPRDADARDAADAAARDAAADSDAGVPPGGRCDPDADGGGTRRCAPGLTCAPLPAPDGGAPGDSVCIYCGAPGELCCPGAAPCREARLSCPGGYLGGYCLDLAAPPGSGPGAMANMFAPTCPDGGVARAGGFCLLEGEPGRGCSLGSPCPSPSVQSTAELNSPMCVCRLP